MKCKKGWSLDRTADLAEYKKSVALIHLKKDVHTGIEHVALNHALQLCGCIGLYLPKTSD